MSASLPIADIPIAGHCAPRFGAVQDAFVANFRDHGEIGARVAVLLDGEPVVDLWGGHTTVARDVPWDAGTLVCCMSVSKGVTALAAHLLVERGQLDLGAPVARYWPEFAQGGKQAITVREAMSHRASLGIIDAAAPGDMFDWPLFTAKIAAQAPNWPPCTDEAYHSLTYGFIVGELIRRVDGRPVERFIAEELAGPLDADFVLGCTPAQLACVAPAIPNPSNALMNGGLINARTLALFNGGPADPGFTASPDWLRTVNPSGNGVSHALGIARLFAPLATGGRHGDRVLFSPATLAAACEQQWHHADSLFGNEFRVAVGLLLHCGFNHFGRNGNVGSAGAGGYTVFADPLHRIAFGYTPNRYTSGEGLGDESRRLVDALYRCL